MLIDINDLKGLIINLDSFDASTDEHWSDSLKNTPAVFVSNSEERFINIQQQSKHNIKFLRCSGTIFRQVNLIIVEALRLMDLELYEVAYVSGDIKEIEFFLGEPIGTIIIGSEAIEYEKAGRLPDIIIRDIDSIKSILAKKITGFFSEVNSTNVEAYDGFTPFTNAGFFLTINRETYGNRTYDIVITGRYFGPRHRKHKTHQLSHRILMSKKSDSQAEILKKIYSSIIEFIHKKVKPVDGITRVPPRPSDKRDRFSIIVQSICVEKQLTDLCKELKCIEDYPTQKELRFDDRKENVRGKFKVIGNIEDKHIIILDDVITSGGTIDECVQELYRAGAAKVTVIVLGVNQYENHWTNSRSLNCENPNCDGEMKLGVNKDINAFFGCTKYRINKCKAINYLTGWQKYNRLNTIDNYLLDVDIDDDSTSF